MANSTQIMSFEGNVKIISDKLNIIKEHKVCFVEDTSDALINAFKQWSPTFCAIYSRHELGRDPLNNNIMRIILKIPQATPIWNKNGSIFLNVPNVPDSYRQIVSSDGFIRRRDLNNFLDSVYNKWNTSSILVNGCSHYSVYEKAQSRIGNTHVTQSYIPKVVLEFPWSLQPAVSSEVCNKWMCHAYMSEEVSSIDDLAFTFIPYNWESEITKDTPNFFKIKSLMCRLCEEQDIPIYLISNVLLLQQSNVNWQRELGSLLAEMWTRFVDHLRAGRLDFPFAYGSNSLESFETEKLRQLQTTAQDILFKLLEAQYSGRYTELAEIFGLN
ncbi:cyclic GMP-AMP synthase-like protein [Drosophila takahashii]|uniref:cyclic GMP-AMP synthase-like protein n=1 Tax=Drosophila takahashii TaxID=29030 RepID=UPI0038991353